MIDLRREIPYAGRTAAVLLRLPEWRNAARDRDPSTIPPEHIPDILASAIQFSVARLDGKRLFGDRLTAFMTDPVAVAAILHHRYKLHELLRAMGRVFAHCPHCADGEVEMSLLGYFTTLGQLPPPMISDDFIHFMPPALAVGGPDEPRRWHGVTFASGFRFELPSMHAGLPTKGFSRGVFKPLDGERVLEAREKWEIDGMIDDPPLWWSDGRPVYKATIAMFLGVAETDVPLTTPGMIANMPAYDVYFLDAAYWFVYYAQIPEGAVERVCPACKRTFLPVGVRR